MSASRGLSVGSVPSSFRRTMLPVITVGAAAPVLFWSWPVCPLSPITA